MRGRLHAGVLWVMVAAAWPAMPVVTVTLVAAADAQAQARRSSGGYSRPGGSYARTPSFSSGSRVSPRTPSFGSGGYGRPGGSYSRAPSFSTPSLGDRGFSRSQGGTALNQFRSQQEGIRRQQQQAQQPRPFASPGQPQGSFGGGFAGGFGAGAAGGLFGGGGRRDVRPNWYSNQGWAPPAYALQGQRSFGLLDGLFLYFMLDNLGRAGSTSWFSNNRGNPDYQRWRAQAEQQAQENADLRQKLSELDRRLAEGEGQPKDPNYLPPDTPPAVVTAPEADRRTPSVAANDNEEGGSGALWLVLLAGGGGLAYLAWRRSRASTRTGGGTVSGPASGITTAANMVTHKLSGEGYTPERFRVGMTLQSDPTPFILAAGSIKVPTPEGEGGLVSVTAVGRMTEGAAGMMRLYLPDGRSFLQLHLDAAGAPDECRHFALIDEVAPADAGEWGAWLDPREGMIGWPEFQTKDGKVYGRVWAPGEARIQPRRMVETIEDASGTRTRTSVAMLYAAPTGLAVPAPPTEYILVSAVDAGGQAWVEVHAGIDVNSATLQLA